MEDNLRVQVLSPNLVRLEVKGPHGFENRPTFVVRDRNWPGIKQYSIAKDNTEGTTVEIPGYKITVAPGARDLSAVKIADSAGHLVYQGQVSTPEPQWFPGPADKWGAFAVADNPRIVPPAWGATPAPPNSQFPETSGWDTTNQAPDVYVFLNRGGGYRQFVKDYLKLTGHIEMPPLFAFGLIDSRYHPYTQEQALGVIDRYREEGFPLDMFVVDTDWRTGASLGYHINTKLWPDMAGFLRQAHERGVRTMFNDHPEPQTPTALDPKEMQYRWDGLTSLLKIGADVWWYDRNWITRLHEPAPGLRPEIWGERVFHDMTQRFRPTQRPMIMSNVQGIDNGIRKYPPQPGFHRFPIYWTGDTGALWPYLKYGIANAVDGGVESLLPFMSEDLTGHWGHPTDELYVRFMQYGCLSPITRIHCTAGETRLPWDYGKEAEAITRDYVNMRYRLLPTIYSAARRAHDDGTPVLRRCDLEWPQYKQARDNQQYLLGDDILVAPVNESKDGSAEDIPAAMYHTKDGKPGLLGEYFDNVDLEGKPVLTRIDKSVSFEWGEGSPDKAVPKDKFSARWTGVIGPMPETGDYVVGTNTDDGAKLYLDGHLMVSKWVPQGGVTNTKTVRLDKGKSYDIEFRYYEDGGDALAHLVWIRSSQRHDSVMRTLWLPPGEWVDAWTGARLRGPSTVTMEVPLWKTPIFIREGGVVFLSKVVKSTGLESIWKSPVADLYVPTTDALESRELYEDDGLTPGYLSGECARTTVSVRRAGDRVTVNISGAKGDYPGLPLERAWKLNFHLPEGTVIRKATLDGEPARLDHFEAPSAGEQPMPFRTEGPNGMSTRVANVRQAHEIVLTLGRSPRPAKIKV